MPRRIGYVLLEFPRYSETFITNEILALREHDIPQVLFSLEKPAHSDEMLSSLPPLPVAYLPAEPGDVPGVFTGDPEIFAQEFQKAKLRVSSQADAEMRWNKLGVFQAAAHIAHSCHLLRLNHLHCHYATVPSEVGALAAKLAGISFSFTGHAKDIFTMKPAKLGRLVHRAKFVVTCSRTGLEHIAGCVAEKDRRKLHCIYHGVDAAAWSTVGRRPGDPPVFAAVGRLTAKKGFQILPEVLSILAARGEKCSIEIAGEGRMRGEIETAIKKFGVGDSLRLLGKQNREQIVQLFERSAALVHPSIILESNNQDGIANVVLEAMAAGLPVIVSDIPALLEVIENGKTGTVCAAGNATAFADAIQRAIENPEESQTRGQAGQTRARMLTIESAAQQLRQLFEEEAGEL